MSLLRQRTNRRVESGQVSTRLRVYSVVGLLVSITFAATVVTGVRHVLDPATLPIREVRIEGEFRYLAPKRLQDIVAGELKAGFFRVNVEAIRAALLAEPWVNDVSVRRVWPDTLQITVAEQRAVAYWGDDGLVNEYGVVFHPAPDSLPRGLIRLLGPQGSSLTVLRRYREAQDVLAAHGLAVTRVRLSSRRAWRLWLSNGTQVVFGRNDFHGRLARLARVVDRVLAGGAAAIVDLRYTNGLAVTTTATRDKV